MIGLGSRGRLVLIGIPFLWFGLFFLLPLLIVVKISLAHSAIGIPPYTPLVTGRGGGSLSLHASLANFALLTHDELYLRAYLARSPMPGWRRRCASPSAIRSPTRSPARRRDGAGSSSLWSSCRSGRAF